MNTSTLYQACKQGNIEALKKSLSENPSELNEKDFKVIFNQLGWSLLYRTVISGHFEATRYLLDLGANVNIATNFGETPLHQAADNSNHELSKLLLQYGADPNFQQNEGDTPLHFSAFRGDLKIVSLLLENNASPNIQNKTGRTPLHYAVDCAYLDCVKAMIEWNADPLIKDTQGKSAFDLTEDSEILKSLAYKKLEFEEKNLEIEESSLSEYAPDDLFLERNSYSKDKIDEILRNETTAVNSSKNTKQNKFELKPIYDWLEKINMTEYYELIVSSGYDTLESLIKDSANLSISIQNFITKPGHRRKMLFKIHEETSKKGYVVLKPVKSEKSIFKCCGNISDGTRGINTIPSLRDKLKEINMETYYQNFVDAGFDDYETMVMMVNSNFAIDYSTVENEIKIKKEQQIKRILKKIDADSLNFFGRKSIQITYEDPKSAACETCGIF